MTPRDLRDLLMLAALWGGSFLFMRVAVPELGPVALIELRLLVAALFLLPVLALRGGLGLLARHAVPMTVLGVVNSALPFCLFAYAMLSVTAGFASILNATTPMWGAIVARIWLGERLAPARIAGLAIGFSGIVVLAWGKASFVPGGSGMAIVAAIAAALSYGIAASYARCRLAGVDALAVATGSQAGAALVLAPLALVWWPQEPVSAVAWGSTLVMGVACTGIAYILYFRLIERAGPSRAITVTFLVPVFAVLWGALVLGESLTGQMLAGGLVILLGTALSTGLVEPGRRARADGAQEDH
ncbi:MAG TPA: DMT family transporter [Quisquiliibacterium sp.]|nr:DMT family transporter [Quisquiliibacterium sp.]